MNEIVKEFLATNTKAMAPPSAIPADKPKAAPAVPSGSVRIDAGSLDTLMNSVGELVLAQNQLLQLAGKNADGRGTSEAVTSTNK